MTSPARQDLLQGTLDLLVLKVLAPAPLHGYGIAQRIRILSQEALAIPQGSLYPALHRLEGRGWLRSDWRATETGREAKFYALTPRGRRQLRAEREDWDRLTLAIARVLQGDA
jgi:transcriptional regulator